MFCSALSERGSSAVTFALPSWQLGAVRLGGCAAGDCGCVAGSIKHAAAPLCAASSALLQQLAVLSSHVCVALHAGCVGGQQALAQLGGKVARSNRSGRSSAHAAQHFARVVVGARQHLHGEGIAG